MTVPGMESQPAKSLFWDKHASKSIPAQGGGVASISGSDKGTVVGELVGLQIACGESVGASERGEGVNEASWHCKVATGLSTFSVGAGDRIAGAGLDEEGALGAGDAGYFSTSTPEAAIVPTGSVQVAGDDTTKDAALGVQDGFGRILGSPAVWQTLDKIPWVCTTIAGISASFVGSGIETTATGLREGGWYCLAMAAYSLASTLYEATSAASGNVRAATPKISIAVRMTAGRSIFFFFTDFSNLKGTLPHQCAFIVPVIFVGFSTNCQADE